MCSPIGRNCIEEAIGQDFNCSISCEGVYADVQWLGASDGEEDKKVDKIRKDIILKIR